MIWIIPAGQANFSDDIQRDSEHVIMGANVILLRLSLSSGSETLLFILLDHQNICWKNIVEKYHVDLKWFVDSGRGTEDYYVRTDLYQLMKPFSAVFDTGWNMWRLDGMTDIASIEMDGFGGFTMYYASGSVETDDYLECTDEYENGDFRYDCYTAEGEWIVSFYFDSDTQLHIGNDDGPVYLLDTQAAYQGFWEYPDGTILEISDEGWNVYEVDELTPFAGGPVEYGEEGNLLYLQEKVK